MVTHEQIKLKFIETALQDYGKEVQMAMQLAIRKKRVIDTSALVNSIAYTTDDTPSGGIAKIMFREYGRYIDMGVGKGKKLGLGIKGMDKAIQGRKQRKPRKIYSPIAYGKLNGLIGDLMYGLTEETIQTIKTQLEQHVQHSTI